LLAASLAAIAPVSVPTPLGYQVPLNGSGGGATSETFAVTSSNPDITAAVATGKFLTMTVSHVPQAGNANDVLVQGSITFQLFEDLTPLTASKIESFVQSGFYNGKNIHRIANGFPGTSDFIIQGGSASGNGSGFSGLAGNPFVDEFQQQIAFTGKYQLAMANAGPDTNDTQFFITTGAPQFLDFKHTIFGQVVAGSNIVDQLTKVAKGTDGQTPLSPILINSAVLSATNPNGVIHIDATKAAAGETSTIMVTATDPATHTTATQSFPVNVVADTQNERTFLKQLPYPTQVVTTNPGTTTQPAVVYTQQVAVNQQDIFQIPAVDPEGDKITYTVQAGVTTNASGQTVFVPFPASQGTATVDQNTGIVTVTPVAGFTGTINLLVGARDQTQRVTATSTNPTPSADDPGNFDWHQIILNVSGSTPVALTPIALPVTATASANNPTTIQLNGMSANPATSTGLTFNLTSQPTNGTISNFDATKGTLVYTPKANFEGSDSFQYTVTDKGTGTTNLTSPPATVSITITQANTGAVRLIGRVLVVTPNPRTDGGTNIVTISQLTDTTDATNDKIQVVVNGVIDATQPLTSALDRIVVFGAKASDQVTVDPSVPSNIRVTLDGGHGGVNVLQAGAGSTREHGWFGRNTLIGGTGPNQLVGRKGHVIFKPTPTTDEIFAGQSHRSRRQTHRSRPPTGTFFTFATGRVTPVPTPGSGNSQHHRGVSERSTGHPHATTALRTNDGTGGTITNSNGTPNGQG
jgi:cyclophilin family peptidyl-prolyl cis-trans isomerase